jgi:urease accessory protein
MKIRLAGAAALLLASGRAVAHSGTGLAGGFVPGLEHPVSGPDHLLAMVAVGLWGAFLGPPLIQTLPVVFPMMMVGGAVLAMLGVPVPPVELGVAFSVVVLGSCIALRFAAPVWLAALLVGIFGIFHGYAHGRELPSAANPLGYSGGFVMATGLLHVAGIGLGFCSEWPAGAAAIRGAGAVIAACGSWYVYEAVSA